MFGLVISENAIANILARVEAPRLAAAAPIADAVRASPVVGSDETSARVGAMPRMPSPGQARGSQAMKDSHWAFASCCGGLWRLASDAMH